MNKICSYLRKPAFLVLAALLCLFPRFASAEGGSSSRITALVLTELDNDHKFEVVVGRPLLIDLPSNPSTGYTWRMTSTNESCVSSTGPSTYTAGTGTGTGGGGTLSFPFQAVKAGSTVMDFVYVKPWAPNDIAQTFTVTIHVSDNSAPQLSFSLEGQFLVLSWLVAGGDGFYVEGTKNLSAPQWSALNALQTSDGVHYTVHLPVSGESSFFRLRN